MKRPNRYKNHKNIVTLRPGEFYVSNPGENILLHTLLGSCVAACLYDPEIDLVGMNHFLLSGHQYSRQLKYTESEAGRYGVQSMELLINAMLNRGAEKKRLRAKAFGGAKILNNGNKDNFLCVGEVNSRFIIDFLNNEKIPLVSQNLNGHQGRIVFFSSQTYVIDMCKIKSVTIAENFA